MSAAGREMGLSPAVVSKRISLLEDRLGARLFQRTTRHLRLTETGEGYFKRVVDILSLYEEAEDYVGGDWEDVRGLLGGKGANLAEMSNLGVPVPAGFTISTEMCDAYYKNNRNYPPELMEQVKEAMQRKTKPAFLASNLKAFEHGYNAAAKAA